MPRPPRTAASSAAPSAASRAQPQGPAPWGALKEAVYERKAMSPFGAPLRTPDLRPPVVGTWEAQRPAGCQSLGSLSVRRDAQWRLQAGGDRPYRLEIPGHVALGSLMGRRT